MALLSRKTGGKFVALVSKVSHESLWPYYQGLMREITFYQVNLIR